MTESQIKRSPGLYVAGVAAFGLLLAMAVLLALLLAVLRDSQRHIRDTDARIARIEAGSRPVFDDARPGVREIAPTLRAARPLIRDARGLIGPVEDAVANLSTAAARLPQLATDVASLASDVASIASVAQSDRVQAGLDALPALRSLPHIEELSVDLDQNTERGVELQTRTLAVLRQSLTVQQQLQAIADETLQHARSIDQKLGGQVPTVPARR